MSRTVPATSSYWKRNQQRLAPWLFLAPGMIMFSIYVIIPIFESIWISFYDWDGLGPKPGSALPIMSSFSMTRRSIPR